MATNTDDHDAATAAAHLVEFDADTESATEVLVTAIAEIDDRSPIELAPLYEVIDPEALDRIVASVANGAGPADVEVVLDYEGHAVTVHGYGVVEISGTTEA